MRRNKVLRGFGTVFKRENKYYVYQYRDLNGKIKTTVLKNDQGGKITTFTEAKIAAVKIYEEVDQIQKLQSKVEYLHNVAIVKHIINLKQIQLGNIWENYLANPNRPDSGKRTLETYEGILKAFLVYCSNHQIQETSQLTPEFAGQYLQQYWQTNIAPRTYNRHLQALKLIFKTVLKEDSPFDEFRAKPVETESHKPFTPEQINQIFAKVDDPNFHLLHKDEMRIMLMLGLAFGLRLHDAACFQWRYIKGDIVEFKPIKTKKHLHHNLVIPIPEILQEQFKKAESWKVDQYVLPNVAKRYGFNTSGISQDVAKLLRAAGIETKEEAGEEIRRMKYVANNGEERTRHISRYSFHSFRHTFCSMAANAGVNLSVVRSIVGHTNVSMTEHYTHYSLESKRRVIEAMPLPAASVHEQSKSLAELFPNFPSMKLAAVGRWLEDNLTPEQRSGLMRILH